MTRSTPEDISRSDDEDDLPEVEWEIVSQRKRIPEDLRGYIDLPVAILRVSRSVDRKIRDSHQPDIAYYEQLDNLLPNWAYAIPDPKSQSTWQVYVPLSQSHWLAVIIGRDRNGSVNLISMFRIRSRNVQSRIRKNEA